MKLDKYGSHNCYNDKNTKNLLNATELLADVKMIYFMNVYIMRIKT